MVAQEDVCSHIHPFLPPKLISLQVASMATTLRSTSTSLPRSQSWSRGPAPSHGDATPRPSAKSKSRSADTSSVSRGSPKERRPTTPRVPSRRSLLSEHLSQSPPSVLSPGAPSSSVILSPRRKPRTQASEYGGAYLAYGKPEEQRRPVISKANPSASSSSSDYEEKGSSPLNSPPLDGSSPVKKLHRVSHKHRSMTSPDLRKGYFAAPVKLSPPRSPLILPADSRPTSPRPGGYFGWSTRPPTPANHNEEIFGPMVLPPSFTEEPPNMPKLARTASCHSDASVSPADASVSLAEGELYGAFNTPTNKKKRSSSDGAAAQDWVAHLRDLSSKQPPSQPQPF